MRQRVFLALLSLLGVLFTWNAMRERDRPRVAPAPLSAEQERRLAGLVADVQRRRTPPPEPRADEPAASVPAEDPAHATAEATTVLSPPDAVVAAAEHTLRGRVVDLEGAPRAGVHVTLLSTWLPDAVADSLTNLIVGQGWYEWSWPGAESSATTGADGAFALRWFEGGGRVLFASVGGELRWVAYDVGDDHEHEIVLSDARPRLEGRVVRAGDGLPLAGARVSLLAVAAPTATAWLRGADVHFEDPPAWGRVVPTDADGRWSVDDVPCATVRAVATYEGLAPGTARVQVPASGVARADFALTPGFSLTARVVDDATGSPVAGACLCVGGTRAPGDPVVTSEASDADGTLRVEHVAGSARSFRSVSVVTNDYALEEVLAGYVDETRPEVDVEIRLRRPASVRVRCTDAAGDPIPDAIVEACSSYVVGQRVGDVQLPRAVVEDRDAEVTDADGRAEIVHLHPGGDGCEFRATIYRDGVPVLERTYAPLAAGEDRDLGDVVLERSLTVRGTALLADGAPAIGITVVAVPSDAADPEHHALASALIGIGGRRATTDAAGSFVLTGLTAGLWDVAAARGLEAGAVLTGVAIARTVPIRGRVTDARGAPVAGAIVGAMRDRPLPLSFQDEVACDADGRFEVPGFLADGAEVDVEVRRSSSASSRSFRVRPGQAADLVWD